MIENDLKISFQPLKHLCFELAAISEAEAALSQYNSVCNNSIYPIWAVAENYRFEPAFLEVPSIEDHPHSLFLLS